eukprot:3042517-Amphidinium_carterae.1
MPVRTRAYTGRIKPLTTTLTNYITSPETILYHETSKTKLNSKLLAKLLDLMSSLRPIQSNLSFRKVSMQSALQATLHHKWWSREPWAKQW